MLFEDQNWFVGLVAAVGFGLVTVHVASELLQQQVTFLRQKALQEEG